MTRLTALLDEDRPLLMGILNVTPDSFSDGGKFLETDIAVHHALQMVTAGADIIDLGGESTRPGAAAVAVDEELARVVPVIERLREESSVAISIDTSKSEVMRACSALDIDLINDVKALQSDGALAAAAEARLPVCLMHMQGEPRTMQASPHYEDVVAEVDLFFTERVAACVNAGIDRSVLMLDPGFGFGKTPAHNLGLINQLKAFSHHELPILVGLSRKSTIKRLTDDLVSGSIAGALAALENGARVIRAHDVAETRSAMDVWHSIKTSRA